MAEGVEKKFQGIIANIETAKSGTPRWYVDFVVLPEQRALKVTTFDTKLLPIMDKVKGTGTEVIIRLIEKPNPNGGLYRNLLDVVLANVQEQKVLGQEQKPLQEFSTADKMQAKDFLIQEAAVLSGMAITAFKISMDRLPQTEGEWAHVNSLMIVLENHPAIRKAMTSGRKITVEEALMETFRTQ